MILADKIVNLRKKAGWSQEELAEKMGVSRQSISKWEGAQSVPDMNRILKLSEVFHVSTDYLLRDDMEELPCTVNPLEEAEPLESSKGEVLIKVSLETANEYLEHCKKSSVSIATGVMLCILSPILLIYLSVAGEMKKIPLTEDQGAMAGLIVMFCIVASAVAIFIINGHKGAPYQFLEKEPLDTEYGIDGMVRDKMKKYEKSHIMEFSMGVVLCIISCVPIFLVQLFYGDDDFLTVMAVGILLILVSIGVFFIVRTSIIWDGYQVLLEEGDYTRIAKQREKSIGNIYWPIVTAVYLFVSFITMKWGITWVIWPVAGILYSVVAVIYGNYCVGKGKR